MFDDWITAEVDTGEARIFVRRRGDGPPVLMLHGHPQTHAMWHLVAPALARDHAVVLMDLRGYGRSSKPAAAADHTTYSKRAMARDALAVMRRLGFERFAVVGHDRGGRCAYRLALDEPAAVSRLAVLDIIPTADVFRHLDRDLALAYWHWLFLAQPADFPERLIGADPDGFYFRAGREIFAPEAFAEYRRAYLDPATVHAMCEDYRSGATVDVDDDERDRGRRRIACPVLALWSGRGRFSRLDVLSIWRDWADDVRGEPIDAGHYLAEEAPAAVLAQLRQFLR